MEIKAVIGEITGIKTGAIIVTHYEGAKTPEGATAAVDKKLGWSDNESSLNRETLKASLTKLPFCIAWVNCRRAALSVLGLGKKQELNLNKVRGCRGGSLPLSAG